MEDPTQKAKITAAQARALLPELKASSLPLADLDGLKQRGDGEFFAIDSGADLIRIDTQAGSTTSIPLTPPLPQEQLGLTIDETGMILVNQFSGAINTRYTIDPVDGIVTPMPSVGGILALESDGNGRLFRGGLTFSLGTSSISSNDLTFYSRNLPQGSFGYFLTGPNVGFMPVSSGLLCIGGPQFRYSLSPLNSGTAGAVRCDIDLFNLPSGGPPIAGRTDVFQYWYRDLGSTSTLSAALAVTLR